MVGTNSEAGAWCNICQFKWLRRCCWLFSSILMLFSSYFRISWGLSVVRERGVVGGIRIGACRARNLDEDWGWVWSTWFSYFYSKYLWTLLSLKIKFYSDFGLKGFQQKIAWMIGLSCLGSETQLSSRKSSDNLSKWLANQMPNQLMKCWR